MQWRTWLRIAQIIGTIILIGLLLDEVRWADLRALATNLRWGFVAMSASLMLIGHLVSVARWQYLLQSPAADYGSLLALYGAGLFSSNFLPTGFGGDGVRISLLSRCVPLPQAIFSVALDRASGLLALSAPFVVGLWFGLPPGLQLGSSRLAMVLGAWKTLLTALLVVAEAGLLGLVAWRRLPRLRSLTLSAFTRFTSFGDAPQWTSKHWFRLLSGGYGFSVVSQLGVVAAHWAVIQALGIEVSPGVAIWLVLGGAISLLLPIAVNGLGLQENIYIMLLVHYRVPATAALGVALLVRILMVFFSLLGGLISLSWDPRSLQSADSL